MVVDIWKYPELDKEKTYYIYGATTDSFILYYDLLDLGYNVCGVTCDKYNGRGNIFVSMDELNKETDVVLITQSDDTSILGLSEAIKVISVRKQLKQELFERDVYIYGAGGCGRRTKILLEKYGVKLKGVIDSDEGKQGYFFENLPIISPLSVPVNSVIIISTRFYIEILDTCRNCIFGCEVYVDLSNSSFGGNSVINYIPLRCAKK